MINFNNIFLLLCLSTRVLSSLVSDAFCSFNLVPQIFPTAPQNLLVVQYPNATVNLGNQISTLETLLPPNLSYGADPGSYYSMLMFDFNPPIGGIALQWGIGNIEGNATSSGTLLSKYFPPDPVPVPRGFAFLLYQQPGKLQFDLIDNVKTETSIYFDLNGFVQKHNLTGPLNGNFFISIVPVVSPIINEIL